MFINKFNKQFIYIIIILLFFLLSSFHTATADNTMIEVKDKMEEQNKILYDELKDKKRKNDKPLDAIMDKLEESDTKEPVKINLGNVTDNLHINSIKLSLGARKYIVPVTILILLFNTFMLSTTGAKSYKNRRKYLIGSVFIFIFFMIILNFPLYLLWRQSLGIEGFLSLDGFYRFVEGLVVFLKENSFVFFVIVFTFGIINMISSEYNYPRQMASKYLIKMSFALLILFNILPFVLKLAI